MQNQKLHQNTEKFITSQEILQNELIKRIQILEKINLILK